MSRIAVIAAMHEECAHFRSVLNCQNTVQSGNLSVDTATWHGHEVLLIESGIGKVNATLAACHAVQYGNIDLVINTGSAGGLLKGAQIGDFVVAKKVCHHDIDISPIGFQLGELPGLPVHYPTNIKHSEQLIQLCESKGLVCHAGDVATGDSFVYQSQQLTHLTTHFPEVIACEMEAAAVAQVCHIHNTDFVMLRNLSDIAGAEAPDNFQNHIKEAGRKSSELVLDFIQAFPQ